MRKYDTLHTHARSEFLLAICVWLLSGCSAFFPANSISNTSPGVSTVSISLSPSSTVMSPDASQQFQPTITGTTNETLTWEVNGVAGGNKSTGIVSSVGLYTAPSEVSSETRVTVTAISMADPTVSGSAQIDIRNSVSIDPPTANIPIGGTGQFLASVNGAESSPIQWAVNGLAGGNAALGTITSAGLYTAPLQVPTVPVTVTAIDASDLSASANAAVSIFDPALVSAHNSWLAGVAAVAPTYGCTDISTQQQPTESLVEVIGRFKQAAKEGSCLVLSPVSIDPGSLRYSLAWGGQIDGKDLLYISDVSEMRIWNDEPATETGVASVKAPEQANLGSSVTLSPGDDIQAAVNANPEGTTFTLLPGVYRMQSVKPKNEDKFIGQGTVVLNGSQVLSFEADPSGSNLWGASASFDNWPYGNCQAAHPLCYSPQDLFIDNVLQTRVSSLNSLVQGSWYFDQNENRVYLPNNPAGHTVEIGMTHFAFSGTAQGVQISHLTVEKYDTFAQRGAIGAEDYAEGWIINNVEVRWNHGTGIKLGSNSEILNSFVHHNGQTGVGCGRCSSFQLINNEISWNNYAGYKVDWEAGGGKFLWTNDLVVRSNYIHDNLGTGIWADTNNIDTLYENNTITRNETGIQSEASYSAIIRNNVIKGNGTKPTGWFGNAQIFLEAASNTEVYGNDIEVPDGEGNGISLLNEARGSGTLGPFAAAHDSVHDNTITYLSDTGWTGIVDQHGADESTAVGNSFNSNRYILRTGNKSYRRWLWFTSTDWSGFLASGQEVQGTCCN